ncbi:MAG: hypothetical protein AAF368_10635 [Planctomycetota bacterium]
MQFRLPHLIACALTVLNTGASAQTAAPVLYSTDFATLDGWSVTTDCVAGYSWAADATPDASSAPYPATNFVPYMSAPASLNFNDGQWIGGLGAHGGADWTCGSVTSPPIDLSSATRLPVLRFMASGWMETGCFWDRLSLRVQPVGGGAPLFEEECVPLVQGWDLFEYSLDSSWGLVEIEFEFNTLDDWGNSGVGPFIDDLEIIDRCDLGPNSPCEDFLSFCAGDGTGTPCPCGNNSNSFSGQGCSNSSGQGATLIPSGNPEVLNDTLRFQLDGAPAQSFAFLVSADNALPMIDPGQGLSDYDGLRCVGGNLFRHGARATDLAGQAGFATPGWGGTDNPASGLVGQYGFVAGQSRYFQVFVRDDVNAVCGTGGNRSQGVKVTFQ